MNRLLAASLLLPLVTIFLENGLVHAQITADGSLKTTVSQNGNNFTITNGSLIGNNLFHSFQQFSVPTGGSATFNLANTPNISTIFSRVTGGSVSNIDGSIQTINSSNPVSLFLLNPNGIIFGPNAKLNIGGSFIASTASSIRFADGVEFSATSAAINPLLTISVPIGLQMGQNPGTITVQGSGNGLNLGAYGTFSPLDASHEPIGLQVGAGNTLALIGGQVNFSGGVLSTNGGGHLEIGSVSNGEVKLNSNGQGWVGDYSGVQQFNDIYLAQQSLLNASGSNGSIQLQGRNITLTDGSTALIQNFGAQSGGITVNASGTLTLKGNAVNGGLGSLIRIDNLGTGQTGDITVSASQLSIQNGGEILGFSPALGGNVIVNVSGSINLDGFNPTNPVISSGISTVTVNSTNSGNVTISTGNLSILDGGAVGAASVGSGQTGTLIVNTKDLIEIAGINPLTLISSSIGADALSSGNAGNTIVNTSRLVVEDSASIGSTALAAGSAGNVIINASDSINIQGKAAGTIIPSRISSTVEIPDSATRLALGLPAIPRG